MMKQVPFGNTGVTVSQMCLGTMMFGSRCDEAEAGRVIADARDRGITFLDTAAAYGDGRTEEILGRVLAGQRDRFFVATKVNVKEGADYPAQIGPSLDASLQRLRTGDVDLLLLHWPRVGMDPLAIMTALGTAVRAGKTRFIGCCNFPAWLVVHFNALAAAASAPKLVNNQIPYNLVERGAEVEVLPQAAAEHLAITCYRPLLAGVLSGKYQPGQPAPAGTRGEDEDRIARWVTEHGPGLQRFIAAAQARGVTPAQLAIAWLKDQLAVTCPIVGISRLAQVAEAAAAFDLQLTDAEKTDLAAAFGAEVKEVSQYYGPLRRRAGLIAG